jgi:hypothetical protein
MVFSQKTTDYAAMAQGDWTEQLRKSIVPNVQNDRAHIGKNSDGKDSR